MEIRSDHVRSVLQPMRPSRGHGHDEGRVSRDSLAVFSAGGHHEQFRYGQERPLFGASVQPFFFLFFLPTMASPALQEALKGSVEEAVVICDNMTRLEIRVDKWAKRRAPKPERKEMNYVFCFSPPPQPLGIPHA